MITMLLFLDVCAQMDNKFYHPGKEFLAMDSLNIEQVAITKDNIWLTGIFIKPVCKPKATIFFTWR